MCRTAHRLLGAEGDVECDAVGGVCVRPGAGHTLHLSMQLNTGNLQCLVAYVVRLDCAGLDVAADVRAAAVTNCRCRIPSFSS